MTELKAACELFRLSMVVVESIVLGGKQGGQEAGKERGTGPSKVWHSELRGRPGCQVRQCPPASCGVSLQEAVGSSCDLSPWWNGWRL
jgi:hypothetical protein